MNFDYIRMLTYVEVTQFISKALAGKLKTNILVTPTNIKAGAVSQEVEFNAMASNGTYLTGKAVCTNFGCVISISDGPKQNEFTYNNEWAKWVYSIFKSRDAIENNRIAEIYKADYNDHCQTIRDAKRAEIEQQFETSLLR